MSVAERPPPAAPAGASRRSVLQVRHWMIGAHSNPAPLSLSPRYRLTGLPHAGQRSSSGVLCRIHRVEQARRHFRRKYGTRSSARHVGQNWSPNRRWTQYEIPIGRTHGQLPGAPRPANRTPSYAERSVLCTARSEAPVLRTNVLMTSWSAERSTSRLQRVFPGHTRTQKLWRLSPCASASRNSHEDSSSSGIGRSGTGQRPPKGALSRTNLGASALRWRNPINRFQHPDLDALAPHPNRLYSCLGQQG